MLFKSRLHKTTIEEKLQPYKNDFLNNLYKIDRTDIEETIQLKAYILVELEGTEYFREVGTVNLAFDDSLNYGYIYFDYVSNRYLVADYKHISRYILNTKGKILKEYKGKPYPYFEEVQETRVDFLKKQVRFDYPYYKKRKEMQKLEKSLPSFQYLVDDEHHNYIIDYHGRKV